jgi:hypothetical protein
MDAVWAGVSRVMDNGQLEKRAPALEAAEVEVLTALLIEAGRALPPLDPARSEVLFRRVVARFEAEAPAPPRPWILRRLLGSFGR